ncbi:mannobiose 2-epimerase [Pedobacter africanus]|uniref:Mannobiose 2-epimerase n=1 Tax=Pedobacter africanus TaxID=151894 RepID=A0ACC6KX28_9SPHI|nr:AGE family epimerase/isomerase [Pedobacter africanus]MDR6783814.1 mannobiose 2-epimerase [Pedobacter africanus]
MDPAPLATFRAELTTELSGILDWWMTYTVDQEHGGFYGKVDNDNIADTQAEKGLVLNARILYTFSSAYSLNGKKAYLTIAQRAFDYLITHFLDTEYGGFYWAVDFTGKPSASKKQVYGQAFVIYALAEYIKIAPNEKALDLAKNTFELLEQYSFDPVNTGYVEALSRTWEALEDLRLSDKDRNEKKSMNTHLHVIEAYTNLYTVWPDNKLKQAIKKLLSNFKDHIIDKSSYHLQLFFAENWEVRSNTFSFGHDIEAAWLLLESATVLKDEGEIRAFQKLALQLTEAAAEGLAEDGGLWEEEAHWWPQAEAMVGFLNAWQNSADIRYFQQSVQSWSFIKRHLKNDKGEWHWGVHRDYTPMAGEDKAGFWKCPYHNGRACIEIIKRLSA